LSFGIIRWRETEEERAEHKDDPSVLDINMELEEIYESRVYGLGRGALEMITGSAAEHDIPFRAVLGFGEMSFKYLAKRRKAVGLIIFILVFSGLGERHLLMREEWIPEGRYRDLVKEFEEDVLPT